MNPEDNESDDSLMAHYIEIGVVTIEGMDEDGEMIFSIDEELAKEIAPELWQSHTEYVDRSLLELFKEGLVEVEYDEALEAHIHITPEGEKAARKKGLIEIDPKSFKDIPND